MNMENEMVRRVQAPTPKFFKQVRRWGLTLGAAGAALLASPVVLPAIVTTLAGYLLAVGLVASAVSSAAVDDTAGR